MPRNSKKNPQRKRKNPQRNPRRRNRKRSRSLPATFSGKAKSDFKMERLNSSTVRVRGYDLVYPTENSPVEGAFTTIPCNPAYWGGTRVASIANSYSQYRPIHMAFDYYPQVSTMTNGLITAGTLWNNVNGSNTTQQSLATSNGGKIFPVYQKARLPIKLQTNLSQNLFNFQGPLDDKSNPFTFLALAQHSNNITPGYFMVSYTFDFKNPIGDSFDFDTDIKTAGDLDSGDVWENTTGVLLTETTLSPVGTAILIKFIDNQIQFWLGGSKIGVLADCVFKLFRNRPKTSSKFDEDYQDLMESNQLCDLNAIFDVTQDGASIYHQFKNVDRPITIDDFITVKQVLSGAYDYTMVSGVFFDLKEVGPGRYNIKLLPLSGSTETIPLEWYVLKSTTLPTEYSLVTLYGNQPSDSFRNDLDTFRVSIMFGSTPIVTTPEIHHQLIPVDEWASLGDIRLSSSEQVFGTSDSKIIGSGSKVLVPRKKY